MAERELFLPVGKGEEEIGPLAKIAFGLLHMACKAVPNLPASLLSAKPLLLHPELPCPRCHLCACAHRASSALEAPCAVLTQAAGPPTSTSSTAQGFLTGCHWPCWAAAATGARGVQLGIKKLTITITGLIEPTVFRVIFQVNSMEIIFTMLANKMQISYACAVLCSDNMLVHVPLCFITPPTTMLRGKRGKCYSPCF